ncbi:hypothetical protein L484_022981 [Morus notabilis]|uniref:Xylanase inhibitor C-terminal domain-containing protein n=1 Tax=Morus notabilis TaxID=981085 RepID=W9RKF0_9ROSA|nr:hypothetical protein L484_022981 [Morus notabilis]
MKEISLYRDTTRLCYIGRTGNTEEDLNDFPEVRLQFAYGCVTLKLNSRHLFMKGEWSKLFCLAMSRHIDKEPTVIVLMAQQHHNIGFELDKERLTG